MEGQRRLRLVDWIFSGSYSISGFFSSVISESKSCDRMSLHGVLVFLGVQVIIGG